MIRQSIGWRLLTILLPAGLLFGPLDAVPVTADDSRVLEYNRDVRPILADYCFACHGPDSAARKAELRLDQREAAIEMGAVVPGSPDDSELLRRVLSDDADEQMPPPSIKKFLSPQQKTTLRRWIEEGAVYQPHWSLIAPRRPPLPHGKRADWCRNPIDSFVLARLESMGLEPPPRPIGRRSSVESVSI